MDTYILRDGKQTGPFSDETLQRLLEQGGVEQNDLAWRKGMAQWIPLQEILEPKADSTAPEIPDPTPPPLEIEEEEAPATPLVRVKPTLISTARITSAPAAKPTPAPTAKPTPAPTAKPTPAPAPKPTPASPAAGPAPSASGEPASPRQKAFLSYMGINFPQEIGKDQAALLVNEAMENAKDPARLARWNEDRFRLYPDLYAAEIQAKKENRANRFFELAETEGADCFDGLGKAHCQVLVGYLDVKFPNWDARESEATWNYFFPAVAEKFPDVVRREWRTKLKYPLGAKVAAELKGRSPSTGLNSRPAPSPLWALFKGLAIGAVAVAAVGVGIFVLKSPARNARAAAPSPGAVAPAGTPPLETAAGKNGLPKNTTGESTGAPQDAPDGATPASPVLPSPGLPGSEAPAETPGIAAVPPSAAKPSKTGGTTPSLNPKPSENTTAVSGAAPTAAEAQAAAAAHEALFGAPPQPASAAPRKSSVVLTKPVEVPLPFGQAKLLPGTQLKLVAQEGDVLRVNYLNMVIPIPAGSTDLAGPASP